MISSTVMELYVGGGVKFDHPVIMECSAGQGLNRI